MAEPEGSPVAVMVGDVIEAYPDRFIAAFQARWGIPLRYWFGTDLAGHEHFKIAPVVVNGAVRNLEQHHLFWIQGFEAGERSALGAIRAIVATMTQEKDGLDGNENPV